MFEKIKEVLRPFRFSKTSSIVDAIKRDHDDLKEMLELLKEDELSYSEKRDIYPDFASLLRSHTWAEQQAVYGPCRKMEELHNQVLASLEEHRLIQELMTKIQETRPRDLWLAKVKVLAELVEMHLRQEEREFLADLSENLDQLNHKKMVADFLSFRQRSQKSVHRDNAGILDQLP